MPWHPAAGPCLVSGLADTPCRQDERVNNVGGLSYDLPLSSNLTVAGYAAARIFISTSARDASVVVRLQDVAPDGTVRNVSAGWASLAFRQLDDRTRRVGDLVVLPVHAYTEDAVRPVEPDQVYELHVEIWNTAHQFPAGHSLRLTIIPSDATSLPTGDTAEMTGVVRLYHDAEHASSLVMSTVSGHDLPRGQPAAE
jgi:predicted acyl esterase